MKNSNPKLSVQKSAGSNGVGHTKSQKLNAAQKSPKGRVGGTNTKATVSPMKMGGRTKRGC